MSLAATMIMALFFQIITSLLLIFTTASSSPPSDFTIDLIQRRSNSSSSRHFNTNELDGGSPYLLDTGSELIWTQYMPCLNCYNQKGPIYDPYKEKICRKHGHTCLFSYCFSGNAIVAGDGTVATNIFRSKEQPQFYFLNLDAISVGENRVETLGISFHSLEGNIVIDSGTTYTYLPDTYCNLVNELTPSCCRMLSYKTNDIEVFLVMTMQFSGGADLKLDKYNMFMGNGGVYCLAIMCNDPTQQAMGLLGGVRL
ncbi:hypothetical protein EUTSA_v10017843mg [Eutrema salsugineum]|uniref:Uncharacterized protein n=1 Tax=Eutrema salsugineum TaxID=72664 RepID=V4M8B1_EUTSA|nr:hypothetical protein EUTSA_v10017843mg [Eutrema salsugineum]